jgi:spore coat polysaccharide biosynthesis protein SpsF
MSSSRLPGKVLLEIAGQPMLLRVIARASRARRLRQVAVATTTDASDDPIQALCEQHGIFCCRGSAYDVLDRYYQAARLLQAGVVVRLTADCPLIDPQVIDHTLDEFTRRRVDFAANRLPPPWKRTYPIGLDTEVCTFQALERAWKEAALPHEREHVMPYLYDQEGRFRVWVVDTQPDYGHLRWTVDTAEDLELVRRVYAHFGGRDDFSYAELIALFEQQPGLSQINAAVAHKTLTDVDTRMQSLTPNPSPTGRGEYPASLPAEPLAGEERRSARQRPGEENER